MRPHPLRRYLRLAALAVFLAGVTLWAATGAHRGWTKTQITEIRRDEITGLDYPVTRDGLVAGVDLVAAAAGLGVALFGVSLVVGRQSRRAAA